MQKKRVFINAFMSVVQVIVVALVFFILYRFLYKTIGPEKLGIWSLVLATVSVANVANLGYAACVVKFVAKYLARGEEETASNIIQTAVIAIALFFALILSIVYIFASWFLSFIIPESGINHAIAILPYGLIAMWMMVVAAVFLAGLEGRQRIDLKSILLMSSWVLHLLLCFILVPIFDLMGVAYANLIQSFFVLTTSWLTLKHFFPLLPPVPYRWKFKLYKEMVGYGANIQVISACQMINDFIIKAVLTKYSGLATTGFYEMASRMVLQISRVIISANQVLVPAIADLHEKNKDTIQKIYKDSYNMVFFIALPLFAAITAFSPIISQVWIGHYEKTFVLFSILLSFGWFLNILAGPAFFVNLGIGELKWITYGHITTALINLGLGLLLAKLYGGTAVVSVWVFALIIGSFIITIPYHLRHGIPISELFPKKNISVALSATSGAIFTLYLYHEMSGKCRFLELAIIVSLVFFGTTAKAFWGHPMRKRLMEWMYPMLSKKQTQDNRQ